MDHQHQSSDRENSIFSDDMLNRAEYVRATQGQRFLNLLFDWLFMNYVLSWGTSYIVIFIITSIDTEFYLDTSGMWFIFWYIVSMFNYLLYYTVCEKAFRGYTIGKFLTGTRAIREDGNELTFRDALLRSLSRLVPLEAFSGFSDMPWHDSWTRTAVIKSR